MLDMDKDILKSLLVETLQEHHENVVDAHAAHHEWIQERIEAEKDRKEMFKSVRESAIQWSVVGLLGYVGYWLQSHFKP